MISLNIHHRTVYRYNRPVTLGPHRLMLRPRESRELKLVSSDIVMTPAAGISWARDVFGNAVATATFAAMSRMLTIDARSTVELDTAAWPVFDIDASAISFPFLYAEGTRRDLGALAVQQYPDTQGRVLEWAQGHVRSNPTDTLSLLKDLSASVSNSLRYRRRDDEGTQSPIQTLDSRCGSCRDFAVLFIEAVRSLGFGARIVSGYLHNPGLSALGTGGTGSTHAWAEVFIPGAGWITFDPTNQSVGGANLVPVSVARDIRLAMPVTGSFSGSADAFQDMSVSVRVELSDSSCNPDHLRLAR